MQSLDQMHFKRKKDQAQAREAKAQVTLYGRLHTFINQLYDRDCHFQLLEKIVQILRVTYPDLMKLNQKSGAEDFKNAPKTSHHDFKEDNCYPDNKTSSLALPKQSTDQEPQSL